MALRDTSFSPQRVLERLCGQAIDQPTTRALDGQARVEVSSDVTTQPPLYALIIGISKYIKQTPLKGGYNDAKTFQSYLMNDLFIPESQITILLDSEATRAAILRAFQNLITDQRINRDDPIVIFYAGHGAEIKPPPKRLVNGPLVQCIVPQDASLPNDPESTTDIHPIPDFTISALLSKLAESKGNNITVIFDCCHSASGTRTGTQGARFVWDVDLCPLPDDIDSDIVRDAPITRSMVPGDQISVLAMRSHVLLAACGHQELAYEDQVEPYFPGFFTRALVDILRTVGADRLTYKGCMQRFPKLLTPKPQNPICEGVNVDRIFFNAMVQGANSSFILIKPEKDQLYLQAGSAQGISAGSTFAVHADLILGPANPTLGSMTVTKVEPFRSLLKFPEGATAFDVPQPAYGRQTGAPAEQAFDVFITQGFQNLTQPDPRWQQLFSGSEGQVMLRLTDRAQARLVIDVDKDGDAALTLTNLDVADAHAVQRIPHPVSTSFEDIRPVLDAMAHWNWHLRRTPTSRPFQKAVKMEFFKLQESGFDDYANSIYMPEGESLIVDNSVDIIARKEDFYGFRFTSTSTRDLYVYVFYFSIPDQSITPMFNHAVGSQTDVVDPSLPPKGSLTLGYGSGGVQPAAFELLRNQDMEVGIFKIFLTTNPVDMSSIQQDSPFHSRRALVNPGVPKLPLWDVLTMTIVQRRDPNPPTPGTRPPSPTPPSGGGFLGLTPAQQNTMLTKSGFNHGIHLNLSGPPRRSAEAVAELLRPAVDCARGTEAAMTEDIISSNERNAHFAHFGFPSLDSLPGLPWVRARLDNRPTTSVEARTWTTRRLNIPRVIMSVSLKDLRPKVEFTLEVKAALCTSQDWEKFRALQRVFAKWGDVVPLTMELGASLVATGAVSPNCGFGNCPSHRRKVQSIENIIEQHLGVANAFESVMKVGSQGGESLTLANSFEEWVVTTANYRRWEITKVTRVAPIVDLLEDNLRSEVYRLYARLVFRSPYVGVSRLFDFDGAVNGPQKIQQIILGFSDLRIERITVRYVGGLVSGPHGISTDSGGTGRFDLGADEYITDMFVWATDQMVTSLQFVKNTGHVSPIYGAARGVTQPPVLLSGNGGALVGLSGSFDTAGITQIQGLWRGDVTTRGYRRMQTSFTGGSDGILFNDLRFIGDRSTSRISQITARTPGTNYVGGLQVTYTSSVEANPTQQETPVRGTDSGQTTTWRLEEGEYITRVRGRHDGTSICELQFTTNRSNRESPAFGMAAGGSNFNFTAPKTRDGKDMMLYCMAGKSLGRLNSILFIWAEPEQPAEKLEAPSEIVMAGGV